MASKAMISSSLVTRWGEQPAPVEERLTEALLGDTAATPFPINEELNFKVALWQGNITKLQVDALINCNNEDLNERAGISGQIFVGAGPQMEEARCRSRSNPRPCATQACCAAHPDTPQSLADACAEAGVRQARRLPAGRCQGDAWLPASGRAASSK